MRLAFPDPPLAGEGILLRALRDEDAAWIAAACDTAEMSRWLPQIPSPYSEADAHAFIERSALVWQDGTHAPFVVAGEGDTPLGLVELRLLPGSDAVAEVGYWLRPEARGLGAMTKAVLLVAGWAFGTLGLRRLQLTADPENHASQRVAERAGFTREGVLRSWLMTRVGRRDAVMFSLLPEDRSG